MARFNIWRDYWLSLKQKNEAEYQKRRNIAQFKSKARREQNRIFKIQQTDEFNEIKQNISNIRGNEWIRHNKITGRIEALTIEDINKMNKNELLHYINMANEAVNTREADFLLHYKYATGNITATFDFNRDIYEADENARVSQLRHTLRMQQLYLHRQNTWEDFEEGLNKFMERSFTKENINLSIEQKQRYKRRFFDLYKRALEYSQLPSESRGSPVYALVAEELSNNPNVSIDEIMYRLDYGYEQEQEEQRRRQRENGFTITGFAGLSDEDLLP